MPPAGPFADCANVDGYRHDRIAAMGDHLIWSGPVDQDGHPIDSRPGKWGRIARYVWPGDLGRKLLRRQCDEPRCVAPGHHQPAPTRPPAKNPRARKVLDGLIRPEVVQRLVQGEFASTESERAAAAVVLQRKGMAYRQIADHLGVGNEVANRLLTRARSEMNAPVAA